jgi:hypothetical protein
MNAIAWIMVGFILTVVIVACIVDHEARQERRRKPNIRVPRETLWERTRKYHGDTH